jgi:hypothetical protein
LVVDPIFVQSQYEIRGSGSKGLGAESIDDL